MNPQDPQFDEQDEPAPQLKDSDIKPENPGGFRTLDFIFTKGADKEMVGQKDWSDLDTPAAVRKKQKEEAGGTRPANPDYPKQKAALKKSAKRKKKISDAQMALDARKKAKADAEAGIITEPVEKEPKKLGDETVTATKAFPRKTLEDEMVHLENSGEHDTPSKYCTMGCTVNNVDTWRYCSNHKILV